MRCSVRTKSGGGTERRSTGDQFLIPIDGEGREEGGDGEQRGGEGWRRAPPSAEPPPGLGLWGTAAPPTWSRRTSNRVRYRSIDPTSAAIFGGGGGGEIRGGHAAPSARPSAGPVARPDPPRAAPVPTGRAEGGPEPRAQLLPPPRSAPLFC